MFTGLYPVEHGIVGIGDRKHLPDSIPTVAEIFRRHGYRTVAFTGGVNVAAFFGFDKGFELFRNNGTHLRDNLEELRYWLDEHEEEKFFLFAHGYEPHGPYQSDAIDRSALGQRDAPSTRKLRRSCEGQSKRRHITPFIRAYDAAIHRGDRYVGQLLSHLDKLGLRDKTVVLFLSDHGEEFLEHRGCFHLRTLYREVLEVPFIIAGPRISRRRVDALLPGSVSVGATLLDLAGIDEHELPGPSLAGWIYGDGPRFDKIVSETARPARAPQGAASIHAVSSTTEKLITELDDGSRLYFNLIEDPAKLDRRRSGNAAQALASWLDTWATQHPRKLDTSDSAPLPGDLAEELKHLGYFN